MRWRYAWPAGSHDRPLERPAHGADRAERHHQPLPLEVGHDQLEAAVELAEQVLARDEDLVEGDLGGVGGAPPQLRERARRDRPRHARARGRTAAVAVAAGPDRGHVEVGAHAVGDVRLGARDEPAAVDRDGARADRRHVGPRVGLGDGQRPDQLAAHRGLEPAGPLLGSAEAEDRGRRDVDVRADPRCHAARPAACQLLRQHRVGDPVALVLEPQPAARGQRPEHLVREPAAASHSSACGRSSPRTNSRARARNSSCASVNGGSIKGRRTGRSRPA